MSKVEILDKLRDSVKKISATVIANKYGLSRPHIYKVIDSSRTNTTFASVSRLADACGYTLKLIKKSK